MERRMGERDLKHGAPRAPERGRRPRERARAADGARVGPRAGAARVEEG